MSIKRQRDLLFLQKPFPEAGQLVAAQASSRPMQRRLRRSGGWKFRANARVATLNCLGGSSRFCSMSPSKTQSCAVERVIQSYKQMGRSPEDMTATGAFRELCRESLPYLSETEGPASFEKRRVSLPASGTTAARAAELLPKVHRDLFNKPHESLLREADEAARGLSDLGLTRAYVDPAFQSGRVYVDFLKDLLDHNLIEFQIGGESFMGAFFVKEKMELFVCSLIFVL